jgi:membrane dipeptidase
VNDPYCLLFTFEPDSEFITSVMKHTSFSCIAAILVLSVLSSECLFAQHEKKVNKIHHRAYVIDTHTDAPMKLVESDFNMAERHEAPDSRIDFPRLREGDVDAVFFGLFTSQRERTPENYDKAYRLANQMIDSTYAAVNRNPQMVVMATSPDDIISISKQNKTAICLGMENGFPLARDVTRVSEFYKRGVRYITLCHTSNNDICDSSTDPLGSESNGLSSLGKEVVIEMNRLGMIVDVSHISDKAFYDVIALSKAPVMASHSSARALCDHPRNMSDDMLRALAKNGGVIQICILGDYIVAADTSTVNYHKHKELKAKYNNWKFTNDDERHRAWMAYDSIDNNFPPVLPTIAQAVDHIDHVVKVAGIDHVGIGSDFDGGGGLVDCTDVAGYPKITAEFLKRGYSEKDIDKIWGGNFLRVFRAVEEEAKALSR